MKKAGIFILLLAITAVTFSSCKTHERCPAYGQIEEVDDNNA